MKRLLMLLLVLIPVLSWSQDKINYDSEYKYSSRYTVIATNTVKRKIYQKNDSIIIEKYFKDSGANLSLKIDKKDDNKELMFLKRKDNAPWYYCHDKLGYKYILIGLHSKTVDLYTIWSELEIEKETFE
ncbi:hypothetical protein [Parabacteroides chinchillae]|uniref:DUF4174 domain-containing protein n=1 Tax=Parabacteroides chinchillae TaxID=871327 RepID=A0A8G2F518_9BACT|nr:hypothetical protein [Parabacteroides chinchillae]SEF86502.1 hypothetical protein SAMN05444001_108121 [Parabacteroides chinchillae]